jgi:hypothetical protein
MLCTVMPNARAHAAMMEMWMSMKSMKQSNN